MEERDRGGEEPMFFGTHTPSWTTRAGSSSRRSSGTSWRRVLWSPEGRSAACTCGPRATSAAHRAARRGPADEQGAPADYVRMLFAGASDERRTSRAGSPSRRCCGSTPRSSRDCVVIGAMNRIEIWDPPVGAVHGGAGAGVRRPERGGRPGRLTRRPHRQPTHSSNSGFVGEVSRPLLARRWHTFPGARRPLPRRRAGGDLARRIGSDHRRPGSTTDNGVETMSITRGLRRQRSGRRVRRVRHEVRDGRRRR